MIEERAFPSALMAEKYILSCMLDDPETHMRRAMGEGLTEGMFFHFGKLFEAMRSHYRVHKSLELGPFIQQLHLDGILERVGGASEISGIYSYACGNYSQWTAYTRQLRETYAMRLAITESSKIATTEDSQEAIAAAETALSALRAAIAGPSRAKDGKAAVSEFLAKTQEAMEAGPIPGKSTGIMEIDGISGGMKPGEFWVIGGKPSRGKSVLMLQIAAEFIERKDSVVVFSLEMMRHEIIGRMVSTIGRIDYGKITQPRKLDRQHDLQRIKSTTSTLAGAKFWIDDSANQSAESILSEAIRLRDSHGELSLIVVDYLQLVRGNRNRGETREEEVARVSGGLKQLAKELACPVISATQLNEAGQSRESRAIEQDADAALYIVDDGIKVAKLRNGVRNDLLPLYLNGAYQRFTAEKPTN